MFLLFFLQSEYSCESSYIHIYVDGDNINDCIDNCLDDINPCQADNDNDRLGDICDPDDDNDGKYSTY